MQIAHNGHVETIFYFYYNGQIATNRRAWKWVAGTPGQPTDTTKIDAAFVAAGIPDNWEGILTTSALLQGVRYSLLPNPTGVNVVYSDTVSIEGAGGAVALPKQSAGLIKFKSETLGKRGEGRNYLPFPPAAMNETTGVPTAAYLTAAGILAAVLAGPVACNSTTSNPGTLNPVLIPAPGFIGTPVPVVSATPSHAWATQRRRGDYGRLNKSPFA